jgi:hypothetical protein
MDPDVETFIEGRCHHGFETPLGGLRGIENGDANCDSWKLGKYSVWVAWRWLRADAVGIKGESLFAPPLCEPVVKRFYTFCIYIRVVGEVVPNV